LKYLVGKALSKDNQCLVLLSAMVKRRIVMGTVNVSAVMIQWRTKILYILSFFF